MNFWMNNSINDLKNVISKVDLICINDEEVLQLSQCNDLQQAVEKILKINKVIQNYFSLGNVYNSGTLLSYETINN